MNESGHEQDESLEAAVKGIAKGIGGKLKEVAGELMEDEKLEQEGIEQQEEAERIRAGETHLLEGPEDAVPVRRDEDVA